MRFLQIFLVFYSLMLASLSQAQQSTGTQYWVANSVRGSIDDNKKWEYFLEVQARVDNSDSSRSRFLVRPAVILNLDEDQSVWVGVQDTKDLDFKNKELRLWQQYQKNSRVGKVIFLNRTRLEERFAAGTSDVGLRLRHMLRAQIPFGEESSWSVVVFDEIYLGLNENESQAQSGFDQNRVFLGLRKNFKNNVFLEAGYLNQYTRAGQINHIPLITIGKVFGK